MKQIHYYRLLTFYACVPSVSMKLPIDSFSIGISINTSFRTPVLVLWTSLHVDFFAVASMQKILNDSSAISSQGW